MPRSTATTPDTATGRIQGVVIEAARTQLAATSAALRFWTSFAQAADSYTRLLSDELGRMDKRGAMSSDAIGRLTDISREYLRKLTELPSLSVQEFRDEIDRMGAKKARRSRSARVKR